MKEEKQKLLLALISTVIISGFGALNHFIYDWMNESKWVKWAVATDESTFQHMKMALYPWIVTILVSYLLFKFKFLKNWVSSVLGLWVYLLMVPTFFYFWTLVLKNEHSLNYDIATFIISVLLGVIVWVNTSGLSIDCKLDRLLTGCGYITAIWWFTLCTEYSCPDIYLEPEHSHDHGDDHDDHDDDH